MVFEVLYEVLQLWEFENMEYVTKINDAHYINLEQKHGKEKIKFLKEMETKAWSGKHYTYFNGVDAHRKCILSNLYGRVFLYFGNVFNNDNMPYTRNKIDSVVDEKHLEIVKKYCDFCKMIK